MSYDEGIAERLRELFIDYPDVIEKKMFGGIAFMVSAHMCVGIVKDKLMVRVGPENYPQALNKPHTREMDFTGKPLKGFIYVEAGGFESDDDLKYWVNLGEEFVRSLPPK